MIKLRPMTFEDTEFVNRVRNLCKEMLHDNREFSLEQTQEWFKNTNPRFFIIHRDGESVGYVRTSQWDEENGTVYIGVDIAPEHRRNGYARAAYKLMLDAMFSSGIKKVMLEVLVHNQVATKLYKDLGFQIDSFVEHMAKRGDSHIGGFVMSLIMDKN